MSNGISTALAEERVQTVPVTHTKATNTYPRGTLARIGTSKRTGNIVIQAILIKRG